MTLLEVLVAMSVLLVGVWAVARVFPLLFRSLAGQEQTTQMVKLAQQRLEGLSQQGSPDAIVGVASTIIPDSVPDDPYDPARPLNARDDFLYVEGEAFTVPSPALPPGSGANPPPGIYPFAQGLCDGDPAGPPVEVYQILSLTPLPDNPGVVPSGAFYLGSDGSISPPSGIDAMLVSYAWLDDSYNVHYTNRELVDPSDPFDISKPWAVSAAASPNFLNVGGNGVGIVQDSAAGWGLISFPVAWDPGGPDLAPSPGSCWVENQFGAYLKFNPTDAGKQMLVSYRLRRDRDSGGMPTHRSILMVEDRLISGTEATGLSAGMGEVIVQLGVEAIEPVNILGYPGSPAPGADGLGDTTGIHLLAIDLATGDIFYNDATTVLLTDPYDPKFGYSNGQVKLNLQLYDWEISPGVWVWGAAGHTFRFVYRTPDQNTIQVQKAPAIFVAADTAVLYPPSRRWEVDYRSYATAASGLYTMLSFKPAVAGQTVAVDYLFDSSAPTLVTGEVHTIPHETGAITLDQPDVVAIKAVRGASMRARASWLSDSGKVRVVDVDTLLP